MLWRDGRSTVQAQPTAVRITEGGKSQGGFMADAGPPENLLRGQAGSVIALSVAPGKRDGYYVDVGSADGILHSNTKLLDSDRKSVV